MNARRKCLLVLMTTVLVGALLYCNGCKKTEAKGTVELCMKCGQIEGSEYCCQEECVMCGLDEGSPGCCNIPKDATTAALCTKCGQIKGSAVCCAPDQIKCAGCGLVKGSPGCCKIPKL